VGCISRLLLHIVLFNVLDSCDESDRGSEPDDDGVVDSDEEEESEDESDSCSDDDSDDDEVRRRRREVWSSVDCDVDTSEIEK
jgi:hypothetical protein